MVLLVGMFLLPHVWFLGLDVPWLLVMVSHLLRFVLNNVQHYFQFLWFSVYPADHTFVA
jgi:hypothetical protein